MTGDSALNRVCSIFSQLLQFFPRLEFEQAVRETHAERHARGFTCWGQFVAMLFCQLGQARSLREICGGLAGCEGKLKHLGVPQAPNKSTLAYANEHRPWQLYQKVFGILFARCPQAAGTRHGFRFRTPLLSIDATLDELCASMVDGAQYQKDKARRSRTWFLPKMDKERTAPNAKKCYILGSRRNLLSL